MTTEKGVWCPRLMAPSTFICLEAPGVLPASSGAEALVPPAALFAGSPKTHETDHLHRGSVTLFRTPRVFFSNNFRMKDFVPDGKFQYHPKK